MPAAHVYLHQCKTLIVRCTWIDTGIHDRAPRTLAFLIGTAVTGTGTCSSSKTAEIGEPHETSTASEALALTGDDKASRTFKDRTFGGQPQGGGRQPADEWVGPIFGHTHAGQAVTTRLDTDGPADVTKPPISRVPNGKPGRRSKQRPHRDQPIHIKLADAAHSPPNTRPW